MCPRIGFAMTCATVLLKYDLPPGVPWHPFCYSDTHVLLQQLMGNIANTAAHFRISTFGQIKKTFNVFNCARLTPLPRCCHILHNPELKHMVAAKCVVVAGANNRCGICQANRCTKPARTNTSELQMRPAVERTHSNNWANFLQPLKLTSGNRTWNRKMNNYTIWHLLALCKTKLP